MKYLILMLGMTAITACVQAQQLARPCKTNGQGLYGRSTVYDVGNPTAHSHCWKERN